MNIYSTDPRSLPLSFDKKWHDVPGYVSMQEYAPVREKWKALEEACLAKAETEGIKFSMTLTMERYKADPTPPNMTNDQTNKKSKLIDVPRDFTLSDMPDDWLGNQIYRFQQISAGQQSINKDDVIAAAKDAATCHYLGLMKNDLHHLIRMEDYHWGPQKGRIIRHITASEFANNSSHRECLQQALDAIEQFRPTAQICTRRTSQIFGRREIG